MSSEQWVERSNTPTTNISVCYANATEFRVGKQRAGSFNFSPNSSRKKTSTEVKKKVEMFCRQLMMIRVHFSELVTRVRDVKKKLLAIVIEKLFQKYGTKIILIYEFFIIDWNILAVWGNYNANIIFGNDLKICI